MKTLFYILFLCPFLAFAKEQPLPSTIKKVTVFIEGGQVLRQAATHLPKGKTELILSGLSKYLDPKSIRVKGIGDFTVLAIHNQLDYLDEEKSKENDLLRKQIKELDSQSKLLQLDIQALSEKQAFLKENKRITGTNTPISFSDYNQYFKLYSEEMRQTIVKKNEIEIQINEIKNQRNTLYNQLNEIADKERKGFYKIKIIVHAARPMPAKFEVSYFVSNCGWFPSYDIRIDNLDHPVNLSYKANLRQSTGVDWKNVLLTFSNATPTDAGDVPQLAPFYLGEARRIPNKLDGMVKRVTGQITDTNGEPLYGASIIVEGTSIGTTTDIDGKYQISVPAGQHNLEISYTGFQKTVLPVTSTRMNAVLEEGMQIQEVVVASRSSSSRLPAKSQSGIIGGVPVVSGRKKERKAQESKPIQMDLTTNTTSLEFDIKVPYTILSKPKSQIIEMRNFNMPASYEYHIVPKIEASAYLMAYITDWEQFHLMDGESNLYFENTYVGKALIEANSVRDTLPLSLGKDKSISVTRTNVLDRSNTRLLGAKKIIKKAWKTEIKNNKSTPIKVIVLDQVPVSRKKKIEVVGIDFGSAQYNDVNGEVKWSLDIAPYTKSTVHLNYTVKYPKEWRILVE